MGIALDVGGQVVEVSIDADAVESQRRASKGPGDLGAAGRLSGERTQIGLAHLPRPRPLHWFAVMATWEGIVFGVIYLATGSLALLVVLHAIHDAAGFAFFGLERRVGIWLPTPERAR